MARPRKDGRATGSAEVVEEENEAGGAFAHGTLDDFLRENHDATTQEVGPEGLPSLAWIKERFKTKSAAIRYLLSQGHKPSPIAKHLGVKRQHVQNVMTTPLKRGPNESFQLDEDGNRVNSETGKPWLKTQTDPSS